MEAFFVIGIINLLETRFLLIFSANSKKGTTTLIKNMILKIGVPYLFKRKELLT